MARGDYAAALASAERGLAARPDDPWLLYERGSALAALGRLDEALDTLRLAERRFTDNHDRSLTAWRRALALEFAGRCAEASTEFAHYASLVRSSQPGLAADAVQHVRFCIGPTEAQRAERQETARLKASTDPQVQRVEAASTAAVRALTIADYSTALQRANEGLAIAPEDPWLLYNRGAALAGLGNVNDAVTVLRESERLFAPGNVHGRSVATYRRAIALEAAGRCDEAAAEFKRYAAIIGPTKPQLAEHAREHLRFCRAATGRPSL
jgi:tetratricopeptide (TPR) repeat protein